MFIRRYNNSKKGSVVNKYKARFKYEFVCLFLNERDSIDGVMVCVLISSAVDSRVQTRSSQTNDNKIGICCFSSKHRQCRINSIIGPGQNSALGTLPTKPLTRIKM